MFASLISLIALSAVAQAAQTSMPADPIDDAAAVPAEESSLTILRNVGFTEPRKTGEAEPWRAYLPPPESLEADKREPFFEFRDPSENESGDPVFGDSGLADTHSGQVKGAVRTTPDGEICVFNGSVLPC